MEPVSTQHSLSLAGQRMQILICGKLLQLIQMMVNLTSGMKVLHLGMK
jgi:hypothetical protein